MLQICLVVMLILLIQLIKTIFVITLIPLFFTKYLFVAEWERPKDLNGLDARVIIFWGYVFGMVLPIGLVAFRGYII